MNLLDLIPSFRRQLGQNVSETDTDSILAGYLADGIDALNWRWSRDYVVTTTPPHTYEVAPDVTVKDKRPIILMASVIYKGSNSEFASFRDGDFAWTPSTKFNPYLSDVNELDRILGKNVKLAKGVSSGMRGFNNVYNPERYSYQWLAGIGAI